ncbi:MAG: orotidine-5'-phosphate decarboxylase [Chloroflexota bacterium]
MGLFAKLAARARQVDSLLCVGLDPHPADLPEATAAAARDFCLRLIEATQDVAVAYKPNAAFFEALGPEGIVVLRSVIAAVPEGIPVILDAKRGDIASTAEAYARAAFSALGADIVTVSPYLGHDSISPFLDDPEKGIFLLCKTSNPGSADLQDLNIAGTQPCVTLHEHVAHLAQHWNANDNIGLVVGATHPGALARVRAAAPDLWFLAPGVGAQGGDLEAALQAGLRPDGLGMLIPISRGISRAENPQAAAQKISAEINAVRRKLQNESSPSDRRTFSHPDLASLADQLLDAGCVKFGEFTLKSGLVSPIYLDLRQLVTFPQLLARVAAAYVPVLCSLQFDRIAALPYAALPIGTAVSLQGNWPLIYPRKETKAYGTKADIEGSYHAGETVAVVDDLATTGGSKFEAIEKLTGAGLRVKDIVVLIDRESGAGESLAQAGYQLHTVFKFTQLLDHWERTQRVATEQIAAARAFIRASR